MWLWLVVLAAMTATVLAIPCEEARIKCAYREGCGLALNQFLVGCSGILQGPWPDRCPQLCRDSLTALVSTEEGQALMECECSDNFCEEQKRRTEVCEPDVMYLINSPEVPCHVAERICAADSTCSTAFQYYQRNCKSMFHGKKCARKCQNSIAILRKQERARKLGACKCDAHDDFCHTVQKNMDRLCFYQRQHVPSTAMTTSLSITTTTTTAPRTGTANRVRVTWWCFVVTSILLGLWTR